MKCPSRSWRRKDAPIWYVERKRKWSRDGATLSGLLDVADSTLPQHMLRQLNHTGMLITTIGKAIKAMV